MTFFESSFRSSAPNPKFAHIVLQDRLRTSGPTHATALNASFMGHSVLFGPDRAIHLGTLAKYESIGSDACQRLLHFGFVARFPVRDRRKIANSIARPAKRTGVPCTK
jgi:hypothetical protein